MDVKKPVDSEQPPSLTDPPSLVSNGGQTYGSTGAVSNAPQNVYLINNAPQKSVAEAYILGFPLGFLGLHHYYLHRPGFGIIYTLTFGLFGLGWIADWFRMPCLVKDCNRKLRSQNEGPPVKSLSDAYVLWFPLGGLLGFHHFYLRRYGWGVLYLCTLGLFGLGWIVDAFRMKLLVADANEKIILEYSGSTGYGKKKRVWEAYVLSLPPIGLFGTHHYYLDRTLFGLLYTFTLGLLGVGWLFDLCRMSCLVKRVNNEKKHGDDGKKHLDDAYILCFPFGFLGLHRFYLQQHAWGCLYLFTFGFLGIGWLVDLVRLPCMVSDYNKRLVEAQQLVQRIQEVEEQMGVQSPPVVIVGDNPQVPPGQILFVPLHGASNIDPRTQRPYNYSTGEPYGYPVAPPAYSAVTTTTGSLSEPQPSLYPPVSHDPSLYPPVSHNPPMYPPVSHDPPAYTNAAYTHSEQQNMTNYAKDHPAPPVPKKGD